MLIVIELGNKLLSHIATDRVFCGLLHLPVECKSLLSTWYLCPQHLVTEFIKSMRLCPWKQSSCRYALAVLQIHRA